MESTAVPSQAFLCCTRPSFSPLKIRSPISVPFSQSSVCHKGFVSVSRITASSEYVRWRHRKSLIPNTGTSGPKGFMPRTQVGTHVRKKDQFNIQEQGKGTSGYSATSGEAQKKGFTSRRAMKGQEDIVDESIPHSAGSEDIMDKTLSGGHSVGLHSAGDVKEENTPDKSDTAVSDGNQVNYKGVVSEVQEASPLLDMPTEAAVEVGVTQKIGFSSGFGQPVLCIDEGSVVEGDGNIEEDITSNQQVLEDVLAKQKEDEVAQTKTKAIAELSEENMVKKTKVFIYPNVAKADQLIEVYFDRRSSALINESDILIMGAFNGWRWNFFTERLRKSDLQGDWWSCELQVPKEAYQMDFVFFNGGSVYENNDSKDFRIPVDGGMDVPTFEDFLLEEKRKELHKLAAEQAEREREAEEQQRREAEIAAREADRAQAKLEAERKWGNLQNVMNAAVNSVDNLWYIHPDVFKGGDQVRVFFNRSTSSLVRAEELWIHGGHNNWNEGLSIIAKFFPSREEGGDWWYADVLVPPRALVLDWVFADGPPQKAKVYDNNNYRDFHAIVPNRVSEDIYWAEEEARIFQSLQDERRLKEEAIKRKEEKTEQMRAQMKKKTMEAFLLSQKHIIYTHPLDVQAGKPVTVFYNPSSTVLNGKPDVWFRCSFNRWTHRKGAFPPQKMVPADGASHVKASIGVPLDAYMMDFVFSEQEHGGTYDNRYGMDYHIPVSGGLYKEPPMHIVHIAVEMAPIAKISYPQGHLPRANQVSSSLEDSDLYTDTMSTPQVSIAKGEYNRLLLNSQSTSFTGAFIVILAGTHVFSTESLDSKWIADQVGGLGDVVTSLSRAVQDLGHNVEIILPKYDCINLSHVKDFHFSQSFGWGGNEMKVYFGNVEGLPVYFLEPQNRMFSAGCIYGGSNDGERFGFFCHAALEYLLQKGGHPDILHCHDWSSAPVAWLFKEQYMQCGLSNARVVFTIHNLEFGAPLIAKAMMHADKATTVSKTYAREVSGNPAIAPHLHKFYGIVNGIDPDIWDPFNDSFIPFSYTSENVVEAKKAAKEALQQKLGLKKADLPLVGIITRLTVQKGIHLIKHAIWRTLERNGQVVLLGSAPDPRIQNDFVNLAKELQNSHGDGASICLAYDEPLSHLIYAGADIILVPSIFEPCGLTQLVAMRYGAIPVVRKTGGLYDTVLDVDHDKERAEAQGLLPNGFSFDGTDSRGVDYALNRALSAWYDSRDWFNLLCKHVMEQDWSWNRPALDYLELYHSACK